MQTCRVTRKPLEERGRKPWACFSPCNPSKAPLLALSWDSKRTEFGFENQTIPKLCGRARLGNNETLENYPWCICEVILNSGSATQYAAIAWIVRSTFAFYGCTIWVHARQRELLGLYGFRPQTQSIAEHSYEQGLSSSEQSSGKCCMTHLT